MRLAVALSVIIIILIVCHACGTLHCVEQYRAARIGCVTPSRDFSRRFKSGVVRIKI